MKPILKSAIAILLLCINGKAYSQLYNVSAPVVTVNSAANAFRSNLSVSNTLEGVVLTS